MLVCYYFVSVVAAIGCCCKLVVITNPAVVLSQNTGLFVYSKLSTVQHVLSAEKVQNVKVVPCLSDLSCTSLGLVLGELVL